MNRRRGRMLLVLLGIALAVALLHHARLWSWLLGVLVVLGLFFDWVYSPYRPGDGPLYLAKRDEAEERRRAVALSSEVNSLHASNDYSSLVDTSYSVGSLYERSDDWSSSSSDNDSSCSDSGSYDAGCSDGGGSFD
ncbi:hypothetical protein SAMN02745857_02700 [Andreprevotia lacus DSM 23236]|jgi:hypothetical protein|uniref:Uncharacterized protein n=1 Tax=Andreprevotia lacus DSM 23236 TaxID=1121001 RepID=A0A1W1XT81_9NEIS|nr:hypothetical protein [Andreprevotia lacus]SMC27074.1 hypothetical protein SAMN02745857_02700 [Andreprevotia lacus DSM 23236]